VSFDHLSFPGLGGHSPKTGVGRTLSRPRYDVKKEERKESPWASGSSLGHVMPLKREGKREDLSGPRYDLT